MKTFTAEQLAQYFKIKVPSDGLATQMFGANAIDLYSKLGWLGHNGIDYQSNQAKVFAPFDGTVSKVRKTADKGDTWWISIWSDQKATIDGQEVRLQCTYMHCDEFYVNEGDHVTQDQLIARTDNTGYPNWSTGAHLHFGVYPLYWTGTNWSTDRLNGYEGAVNPLPFLSDYVFDMDKYPEGQLIKAIGDPKVYLIDGRKKRWFPHQMSFWVPSAQWPGGSFRTANIWNLAPFEVARIPSGENMPDIAPEAKKEIASYYPDLLK